MGIEAFCPNGHRMKVKDHLAGRLGVCPTCGSRFRLPDVSMGESTGDGGAVRAEPAAPATVGLPIASLLSVDPAVVASLPRAVPYGGEATPAASTPQAAAPSSNLQHTQAPHSQVPHSQVPLGQVPLGQVPLGQVPHAQAPRAYVPLGQVPLGHVPPGQSPPGTAPFGTAPFSTGAAVFGQAGGGPVNAGPVGPWSPGTDSPDAAASVDPVADWAAPVRPPRISRRMHRDSGGTAVAVTLLIVVAAAVILAWMILRYRGLVP